MVLSDVEDYSYHGWEIITVMWDKYLYFTASAPYESMGRLNLETNELEVYPVFLSDLIGDSEDDGEHLPTRGSFNIKDNLFLLSYNWNVYKSHLVKYDSITKKKTLLYREVRPFYEMRQSFYIPESNSVVISEGMVFFLDDYEIKQFNSEDRKSPKPVKVFE